MHFAWLHLEKRWKPPARWLLGTEAPDGNLPVRPPPELQQPVPGPAGDVAGAERHLPLAAGEWVGHEGHRRAGARAGRVPRAELPARLRRSGGCLGRGGRHTGGGGGRPREVRSREVSPTSREPTSRGIPPFRFRHASEGGGWSLTVRRHDRPTTGASSTGKAKQRRRGWAPPMYSSPSTPMGTSSRCASSAGCNVSSFCMICCYCSNTSLKTLEQKESLKTWGKSGGKVF